MLDYRDYLIFLVKLLNSKDEGNLKVINKAGGLH